MQKITEQDKDIIKGWYTEDVTSIDEFIKKLDTEFSHDYGTICHAVAASAVQAAKMMDRQWQGGITGFQASCIMWEMMKNWMHYEGPMRLIQFEHMLYPQHYDRFALVIDSGTWKYLQEEAKKKLAKDDYAHPDVKEHWQNIVNGIVPFGYTVKEDV